MSLLACSGALSRPGLAPVQLAEMAPYLPPGLSHAQEEQMAALFTISAKFSLTLLICFTLRQCYRKRVRRFALIEGKCRSRVFLIVENSAPFTTTISPKLRHQYLNEDSVTASVLSDSPESTNVRRARGWWVLSNMVNSSDWRTPSFRDRHFFCRACS